MARQREELDDVGALKNGERPPTVFDRAIQEAIGDQRPLGRPDDPAKAAWPDMWRWMTETEVPGGRVKEPATIIIRASPEGFGITLTDRATGYACDAHADHLDGIFEALEAAMQRPASWRRSHNKDPKVRKRKFNS